MSAAPYDHKDTRGRVDETQFATFQACSAVPGCLSLTHLVPADGRSPFSLPRLPGTQSLVPLRVQATLGTVVAGRAPHVELASGEPRGGSQAGVEWL